MEDDWIFLGDGAGGGSDSDSASDDGSDSGFTIVRRGRKGGDQYCSVVVSDDPPAPPLVAAVAVPQPTPPGLSFKVVSYAEEFSASASSSSEGGSGRELMPGCNDDEATAGEAIIQGAGIDDASGTGSTDDCTVTCKEGCESDQVGEHDGTGSYVEAPSVAVAAAPTVNCPETTAVLHGEAHSELASGMGQGGAEEVEDEDSESCEEDDDDDTENSSEDEDDTDSSSEDEDEDMFGSSDEEDEDTFSSSDEEEDTFSSSDEEYTGSFSEEKYTAEIYSEEEEDDDAESSGGEEEEDGSESSSEMDCVESSDEESYDADNTGEVDDGSEISGEEQEEEDDAECSGEEDDVESTGDEDAECTGEEEGDDDLEISGEKEEESDAECSGNEDDVESSGDESDDPESCGADSDDDAESYGEEEEEEEEDADSTYEEEEKEEEDTVSSGEEEESSHVVGVAENGKQDIFAMLFPRATTACDANAEQGAANANGAVKERSESFPSKYYDDMDTDSSGSDMDTDSSGSGSDMDTDSSDMEDDDCLESDEEDDIVDVAQNGNQDIFAMLFPKAKACGANMDDYEDESEHGSIDYEEEVEEEEDGSLFDMLLPRNCAIGDDIDSSDGEDEAATATAACGYNAEPSHGTRRPEFSGRAARGYDDVDTDSDMEDGDGEVAADVNATSLYGWPRARATTGGGVESQCWGFASKSQTERQALWEDLRRVLKNLRRQLAAEAFESSGQQRSYDDVDDTCDLPGTAAPGGGPAGSCDCARTAEAQFTARAVRDTERALAMEEVGRREAAQRELDRALARQAAPAAQALESALQGGPTTKRQATGVTRPAVAEPAVPADITFIICVYVFVFLMVSLFSIGLA